MTYLVIFEVDQSLCWWSRSYILFSVCRSWWYIQFQDQMPEALTLGQQYGTITALFYTQEEL